MAWLFSSCISNHMEYVIILTWLLCLELHEGTNHSTIFSQQLYDFSTLIKI